MTTIQGIEKHQIQAPAWASGGHRQTILGHLFRLAEGHPPQGEAITIELPDGDQLGGRLNRGESDTLVYLFHGLAGDISSGYMRRTAKLCLRLGHSVIRVNHRGCGEDGRALRHMQPYHSGRGEDLAAAVEFGRRLFPSHRHICIGFSLSGNALLLLFSGQRGSHLPDGGIAVNAPINLSFASRQLAQGWNRIYDLTFVSQCREDVLRRQKKGWVPETLEIPRLASCNEFDAIYTGPFGGFGSRDEYYRVCSAGQYLDQIKTLTVLITAEDDPFVSVKDYLEARLSPSTRLWISNTGGHMGYLVQEPGSLKPRAWMDQIITKALETLSCA